jgi:signal transduction histidine kinase
MREFWHKLRQLNLSVWKELLGPTLVLGFLWLMVSTSTTVFIAWQDRIYDGLLVDNVGQIRKISDLQSSVWELQSACQRYLLTIPGVPSFEGVRPSDGKRRQTRERDLEEVAQANRKLDRLLAEWRKMSGAEHQADIQNVLEVSQQMRKLISGRGEATVALQRELLALAQGADGRLAVLQEAHSDDVSKRNSEFQSWTRIVLGLRQFFNLLGPVFGVYLGYRAASRLRRQISRITLRLGADEVPLGAVDLTPDFAADPADLDSLEIQVGRVEQRLKSTLQQLHQVRQEVIRGERLAAVGQLAAGVAHEIRNPLTTVKLLVQTGYAVNQSAQPSLTSREQQQRLIIDEIDRMERTIQSLLEFARPASPRREVHDLCATLRRVANLVEARATQQNVALSLTLGVQPLEFLGDREQMLQVFVNLFLNAIDAMPDGGRLQVQARCVPTNGAHTNGAHTNGAHTNGAGQAPRLEVTVCDDGPGVAPEILDHLFEPFVTSKERGTGLGLAVSNRIVHEHQGTITVVGNPEGGARFTVSLPAQITASLVEVGSFQGE